MVPVKSVRICFTEFIIILVLTKAIYSLRCRSDDGPSDAELKRVIRSCMRKFGEAHLQQQQQQQQQQHMQQQNRQRSRSSNREYYGHGYDDENDYMNDDDNDYDQQQYNRNYNRQQNGYNNNNNMNNHNNNNEKGRNGGGSSSFDSYDSYDGRQRNHGSRYDGSNNNNRTNNGNGNNNNNWNYNQRNYSNNRNSGNSNNNNNSNSNTNRSRNYNNNQNNSPNDSACIVHCFFGEMHMLNNNNYPDRHKVMYILTKDIRDRELRNFYTDTIQECFQYLETQRRRDKCQFSRDLINCMTEYAKGNCDDWNEFNMIFN